jgi:DNA-binding CsgD family transcriptional regulator
MLDRLPAPAGLASARGPGPLGALGRWLRACADRRAWPANWPALLVMLGALMLSVGAAWLLDAWLVQLVLSQTAIRAADDVLLGVVDRVSVADFVPPFSAAQFDDLAQRLDPVMARVRENASGILRVNVVARDGTIVYSDLRSLRGRTIPPSDKLSQALDGMVGAGEETLSSEENADLRPRYGQALEVYVPVRLEGQLVGAYEVYADAGQLRMLRRLLWGGLLGLWSLVLAGVVLLRPGRPALRRRRRRGVRVVGVKARRIERDWRVRLTARELDVLRLMATSHTNRDIAQQLVVSEETVRSHVKSILHKLDQPDRTQAVVAAVREGLLDLPPGEIHPIG